MYLVHEIILAKCDIGGHMSLRPGQGARPLSNQIANQVAAPEP